MNCYILTIMYNQFRACDADYKFFGRIIIIIVNIVAVISAKIMDYGGPNHNYYYAIIVTNIKRFSLGV